MGPADTAAYSGINLMRRKGRTALTCFGVAVAVVALVLLFSLAGGIKRELVAQFESNSTLKTVIVSRPDPDDQSHVMSLLPGIGRMHSVPLTEEDLAQMAGFADVLEVYPDFGMLFHVYPQEEQNRSFPFQVSGISPSERTEMAAALTAGDFWPEGAQDQVVLPSIMLEMAEVRNPGELVGKTVRFKGHGDARTEFKIAGVLDSTKMGFRMAQVMMPLEACRKLWVTSEGGIFRSRDAKNPTYPRAYVRVADPGRAEGVKVLLKNAGYRTLSAGDILDAIHKGFRLVQLVMAAVGGVGLVVGFFGIANTMAMCVLERTREIGIMKALGATPGAILRLFLTEAAALGLIGGGLGVLLGWLGGLLLNRLSHWFLEVEEKMDLFVMDPWLVFGAVGFSMAVSILAGLVPAMRASRMVPVEALRFE